MTPLLRFSARWWPTALVVAVILYGTWLPAPMGEEPVALFVLPYADKWIHAVFGGGLAGAVVFDYMRARPGLRRPGLAVLMSVLMAVLAFMAVDEAVQGYLPIGRPSDFADLLADWGGALLGILTAPAATAAVLCRR